MQLMVWQELHLDGCFYLANSRQMQLRIIEEWLDEVVFTLQTAGRCNVKTANIANQSVVFTLQTAGRCNYISLSILIQRVVFTFQTESRCNHTG
ncbi:hypothetical protein CUC00_11570 [Prevotella intermedia]|nr:hypothetical protein CUC00_11570 [Prevotella intermedia]